MWLTRSRTGNHVIHYIAVHKHLITSATSDVVHFHTVDNVWMNTSQVKGEWGIPREGGAIPFHIAHRS